MEFTFAQSSLIAANAAWWIGFSRLRAGWSWLRCVGIALAAFPLARLSLRLLDLPQLFARGPALAPLSAADLLLSAAVLFAFNLVLPVVGLLIAVRPPDRWRRAGAFVGLPRRSFVSDAMDGQAVIGFAALVFIGGFLLAGRLRSSGLLEGPSPLFDRAGALLLLGITLLAGVSEEFLFRGLLQNVLRLRLSEIAAVVVQAAAFGLAHTGQGGLLVVLGPAALGLAAGLVAARLGLLAAILLHVQADLGYFALTTRDPVLLVISGGFWTVGIGFLAVRRGRALRPLLERRSPAKVPAVNR